MASYNDVWPQATVLARAVPNDVGVVREWRFSTKGRVEGEERHLVPGRFHSVQERLDDGFTAVEIGLAHAAARIEQQRETNGRVTGRPEIHDGTRSAVLEDLEVIPSQITHESAPRVAYNRRDWNNRNARPKPRGFLRVHRCSASDAAH